MEEYERRQRREREKHERQQVQAVNQEHSLFPEPRRVDPSEGDDHITSKLGEYSKVKDFIGLNTVGISSSGHRAQQQQQQQQMPPNAVQPGIIPGSASGGAPPSSSSRPPPSQQQPSHHYQQQQSRQPYLKQADNKPPYNGRGGYPGQPVKNDLRSSSGMAPPKGPPPPAAPSMLQPPSTTIMPNGRQSAADKSSASFLGPPAPMSSASTHNGRFSQPSIPKMLHKLPAENDITQILTEIGKTFRAPPPLTEIASTPRNTIVENYNLSGPNKHKYFVDPIMPPTPLEPFAPIAPLSALPASPVAPSLAPAPAPAMSRPKEPAKPLKTEKTTPTLEKQNSTLEHDLELSESDDERKKHVSSPPNSSESSQSDSSESGSEESMKSEQHQHQQQHQQQPPQRLGGSSATLANSSSGPNNKKKISQTITAGGGTTISGILSGNGGLGSAGSSCSGPSSASSSNKTPSPSDSNKWNLSRYFNKAATQQAQNDASPNGGSGVAMMLPGGAQIIPEPTPTPVSMASANASASVVATVKNETIVDDEDDGEDDDHEDDGGGNCERRPNPADNPASPPLANAFRHPAAFASRKPELSVTPLSPMKHTLLDEIKKESDALFPHQMTLKNLAPQQQHVPMLSAAEFVAIPTSQIKHEAAGASLIAGGVTTVTPYNKRSPASSPAVQQPHRQHHGDDKNLAPELRKHAEEYMPMEVLSGLSSDTNSSDLNDAVTVPVPGPGGTLQIPGVPAAITALPRSPPQLLQKPQMLPNSLTVTLNPASPPPLTTAPVKYKTASPSTAPLQLGGGQRAKKPRKKLKQPPQTATADSSEEDGEYSVSSAAASASVSPAAAGGKLHEPLGADPSAPAAAATTTAKKGRGRPRKNTPNQSGNISSASSTTTKGPTLTAKKDVSSKKPTGRRRLSRQNSSSNAPSSAPVTPQVTPTKVHNAKQQQQAPAHKQRQPQQPQQKSSEYVASSEDSSSSSSSISTSKSSTSSSDSEEDSGSESSASDQKKQSRLSAAASAATSSSATSGSGRRIVKQLNKRKSSLDEVAPPSGASTTAAASGAKKGRATTGDAKESSSSSWSEESSDEEYSVNGANEQLAAGAAPTTYAPSAGGSYRQQNQSPMKVANSSRSRVSTSSSSMGLSTTSSSSGEDQSDSDCDVTRKEKKLRRDKPKSDKKKSSTLSKIFNPKECGAKKQGQVVIIDQSEELLAKEQHHMQQQQQLMQQQQHQMQQKHISPNAAFKSSSQENLATATATATTTTNSHSNSNSLHSSAIGTTTASQSPRLTPSHMKSPRNPLSATQHMITRTPDRCSASAERKLQQRIKTPTRTPTRTPPATRTPTPTQSLGATSAAAGSAPPFTSSPASSLSSITALICKIELSRLLHIAPEWHTNTYRLYAPVTASPRVGGGSHGTPSSGAGRTPIYDHETILNADLQATQLRLKPAPHAGSGGHTPNETAEHQQQRELSRSSESLVDPLSKTGKPRLEDVNTNGRASSRSVDGSGGSTPKDLPPPQAPPNGFTPRGLASTYGGASPSANKLMVGVKHEHIKYEPDVDGKPNAAAPTNYCADTKFKSGSVVKQELILKQDYKTPQPGELTPSDKQLMSVDPPASATVGDVAKPRRKRSSSSSSSPYKEKKRKKDKDKDKDREKDKDTALLKEKDKEKEKLNNNNNRTTMPGDIGSAVNHAQATEKELLLDQQLPPTNHDRLMDKQSFSAPASSPASHLQAATQAAVPAAHMPPPPPSSTASMLSLSSSSTAVALMEPGDKSSPVSVSANALVTPAPPQVIYRSYFERDEDALSDDFSKNTKFLQEAVNRKHAADREQNTFNQVTLYLEAVVYFLLSGAAMEQHRSSEEAAWTMYKDTLALIKFISSKFRHLQVTSSNGQHETHNKVAILSLRCQSLISLKLYKMKRNYCRTIITGCNDFFKSSKGDIVNGNTPSSISPSNSVCSQSSGSNTPPGKIVPQDVLTALMQQNQFFSYLTSSHDLWDQADRLVRQGNHTDFFIALDHENGPLTLHSSMYEVFKYVQAGLKKLKDAMSIQ